MTTEANKSVAAGPKAADAVIIDLGKQRKKRIKQLRKGRPGKLLDEVQNALDTLRDQGTVAANAQPVIIVVRERRPSNRWPGL